MKKADKFVSLLSDTELVTLHSAADWEITQRETMLNYFTGALPTMDDIETALIMNGLPVQAIKHYRGRTSCYLKVAKVICDFEAEIRGKENEYGYGKKS